jgi:TetR/AcrR family transcriptional regulator, transcriptional repressor for nem operon
MKSLSSTSDRILDTAQSLLIAGGYNGFSYADISVAIGIRKASIHHHFPTKADLVAILVDRYRGEAEAGLANVRSQFASPVDQLQSYLGFWQACIRDASMPFCLCAMLASEMQMLPEEVASRVRMHFHNLSKWLTSVLLDGAGQGLFHLSARPEEEAQMLMASVHGAMLSARAFGDPDMFAVVGAALVAKLTAPGRDPAAVTP